MQPAPLSASLPASFSEMREAGELVDVDLIFSQARVPCHRVVLAGTCEYFRAMFVSQMSETDAKEIHMEEMSASTGQLIVQYLYSAQIELTIDNSQDLLSASSMLLLSELRNKIQEFLLKEIEIVNCVALLNLSRLYDLTTLSQQCKEFLSEHLEEIANAEVLRGLQEVDLVDVMTTAESHEARFCLLQNWTLSAEGNKERFLHLMQHVSLSKCSKEFLCNEVMGEELLHNTQGMKTLQHAMQNQLSNQPRYGHSLDADAAQPTKAFAVGDSKGGMWLSDVDHHWHKMRNPPTCGKRYSACVAPGGLILTGGYQDDIGDIVDRPQSCCYLYESHVQEWKTLPTMVNGRKCHSSIHHGHHLYVVGGLDNDRSMNSVESLNMKSLQWSALTALPHAVQNPGVAFVADKLFVLGGFDAASWSVDVQEYESSRETWLSRTPMPKVCIGDAVCFDGYIFVIGGGFNVRNCMRYDPREDTWICLQRPRFSHKWGRALVWKETILICGGQDEDSIEEYSPVTGQWSKWTLNLPSKGRLMFALRV